MSAPPSNRSYCLEPSGSERREGGMIGRVRIGRLRRRVAWIPLLWGMPAILCALLLLASLLSSANPMIDPASAIAGTWRVVLRRGYLDVYQLRAAVPTTSIPIFGRLNTHAF